MQVIDVFIDKITRSIEDRNTGMSFITSVVKATDDELKRLYKKDGWLFTWKNEVRDANRQVYKLQIQHSNQIQGLISIEPLKDKRFIELHLIESAPHNLGPHKKFLGVAGNLVAFSCKLSFEMGFDGYVGFNAKTKLVKHYADSLGAQVVKGNNRMGIFTPEAKKLVNLYYKDFLL